jgi:hypothetical protein
MFQFAPKKQGCTKPRPPHRLFQRIVALKQHHAPEDSSIHSTTADSALWWGGGG